MGKISNINYRNMLEKNQIKMLGLEEIGKALANVDGKFRLQGRAFIIIYYYTGGRPAELLLLKGKDIKKDGNNLLVDLVGLKNGMPRQITIPYSRKFINEFYSYVTGCMPEMFLFYGFRGDSKLKIKGKEYINTSYKLKYYFKKWFSNVIEGGIPPYYLRHNRFSKSIYDGATPQDIKFLKGAKRMESVNPYLHLSRQQSKKIGRFLK